MQIGLLVAAIAFIGSIACGYKGNGAVTFRLIDGDGVSFYATTSDPVKTLAKLPRRTQRETQRTQRDSQETGARRPLAGAGRCSKASLAGSRGS